MGGTVWSAEALPVSRMGARRLAARDRPDQQSRKRVDGDRSQEQSQTNLDQRRAVYVSSAPPNLIGQTPAMVYPGENRDFTICGLFPMTMVTAIVSPRARPKPRMMPPMMPARALRSTPTQIISQRVAPSASAASR